MAVDVYTELRQLVENIFGNQRAAEDYASDPLGTITEQGITDGDLGQVDIRQLVSDCSSGYDLSDSSRQLLQNYTSGGPAPSGPVSYPPAHSASQSATEVVQHLNYVTYATYEDNDEITQQLINYQDYSTNIDNSVDVDVDGDVDGDLDIDTTNVNATGDGAVAAGEDVENAATGDGSQIIDGDNFGAANTGDGAVVADGDIEAPVNTGEFSGVQTEGDVDNTVVGDDNQVVQLEDSNADASTFNFGDGDVQNIGQSTLDDSAVSNDGDATNVTDNFVDDGSALAVGEGDATGSFEDNSTFEDNSSFDSTFVDADDSIVATEQGPGDQQQDSSEEETEVPTL